MYSQINVLDLILRLANRRRLAAKNAPNDEMGQTVESSAGLFYLVKNSCVK